MYFTSQHEDLFDHLSVFSFADLEEVMHVHSFHSKVQTVS